MKRAVLIGLIMTSPIVPSASAADSSGTQMETPHTADISHADWTRLLSAYVRSHEDGINRFDYAALKASPEDRAALDAYIDRLAASGLKDLPDAERFAAYANLYNALTVRLVIEHYPIQSITKIRPGLFSIGPWKQDIIELDGKNISLDNIEHDILRKQFDDPRVHYAVNCASMGCPNLQQEAWKADTLDDALEAAARAYVNHPRGVTVRADGRLKVSNIYRWFREDFGGNERGVISHLLTHADEDLARQIRANPDIVDHGYDWSLNDTAAPQKDAR